MNPQVLIIDDEEGFVAALSRMLRAAGCEVHAFTSPEAALDALPRLELDVVLSDIRMPGISGLDLLQVVKRQKPEVEVVMMTGHATVETAVAALKAGAYDYLTKPLEDIAEVVRLVQHATDRKRLVSRNRELEKLLDARSSFEGLVGETPAMRELYGVIERVAPSSSTVLIEGESGSGKELVARAVHVRSPRKAARFVAINCGAMPEPMLESELFGHVKGAFTGAIAGKEGLFEAANGGTLFLDEIGETPLPMQVKLLRALQEGEVRPVGSTRSVSVDVRVVAATNVNLEAAVRKGTFREDLFYRLGVIRLRIPPLRERVEDIPVLAWHLLRKHAAQAGKKIERIAPEVLEALSVAPWKGNVRELENVVERAVVLSRSASLELEDLPAELRKASPRTGSDERVEPWSGMPYVRARLVALRGFERSYVEHLLAAHGGNLSSAARAAGMDRSNFRRIVRKHKLRADE